MIFSFFKKKYEQDYFSANFDPEKMQPFLMRLSSRLQGGFDEEAVGEIANWLDGLNHGAQDAVSYRLFFGPDQDDVELRIQIRKHDAELDVYFFSVDAVCQVIEEEFDKFMEAQGEEWA